MQIHCYVQGSAYLKRDDGTTMTLSAAWLPECAKEGTNLRVHTDVGIGDLCIRVGLAEPNKLEDIGTL